MEIIRPQYSPLFQYFAVVALLVSSLFGSSVFAQPTEAELRTEARDLVGELQSFEGVSFRGIGDRGNRRALRAVCDRLEVLMGAVLQNDEIADEAELEILQPVAETFVRLFLNISARFDDPRSQELLRRARGEEPELTSGMSWRANMNQSLYSYRTTSEGLNWWQRQALRAGAIGLGLLEALSATTGIAHRRDDGQLRRFMFPPPATPFIGEDANLNRTAKFMARTLRRVVNAEAKQARNENRDSKPVIDFLSKHIEAMTKAEPIRFYRTHKFLFWSLIGVIQFAAWNGWDPGALLWGPTEMGPWRAFWMYQLFTVYFAVAYPNIAGMPAAAAIRSLRRAAGLHPSKCGESLSQVEGSAATAQ